MDLPRTGLLGQNFTNDNDHSDRKQSLLLRTTQNQYIEAMAIVVVVVNHCFTSLFGTKGLLSDNIIR